MSEERGRGGGMRKYIRSRSSRDGGPRAADLMDWAWRFDSGEADWHR